MRGLRPAADLRVGSLSGSGDHPRLYHWVLPLVHVFIFEILDIITSLWPHDYFCPWTRPGDVANSLSAFYSFDLILLYLYLASTTWDQSFVELKGSFFHLLTIRTQALQMSPCLRSLSLILKHPRKLSAYLLLSVNREL